MLEQTGSATLADNVEVVVGDGAQLTFVTVADWDADAVQAQHVRFRLGRDATVTPRPGRRLGGDLVRQYTSVEYTGRGGEAELYGLYFADAGQHLEHRQLVDHSVPDCRSYVGYRGALQGAGAHTVWVGDVLIRAEATGTDTYEINRNLLLTDGARADSMPNLEIETGEVVGAGHASATGRFDDEQLFYLMARGIPEAEARKLVVRGFFAELLNKIPVEELRERLGDAIEARLAKAGLVSFELVVLRGRRRRQGHGDHAPRSTAPTIARRARRRRPVLRRPRRVLARRGRRSPRARSTAARWSAGCTARASTCAPASRPACPPPSRCRSIPSRSATATSTSSRHPSNGVNP